MDELTLKQLRSKAGKAGAEKRCKDGINMSILLKTENYKNNTSGKQGISYNKLTRKWNVYVGYKCRKCNLGFIEDFDDAVKLRDLAIQKIKDGEFEQFFYDLRGIDLFSLKENNKKKEN